MRVHETPINHADIALIAKGLSQHLGWNVVEMRLVTSDWSRERPRRKYILPGLWNSWDPQAGRRRQPSAEDRQRWGLIHQREAMLMKTLATENAQVLAGSDSGASNNFTFPGWTLHRELAAMVEAGYTPMQALRAATRNPARYLGELDRMGTLFHPKAAPGGAALRGD
jgi:imidazolonepropionase-like amidohydrolase